MARVLSLLFLSVAVVDAVHYMRHVVRLYALKVQLERHERLVATNDPAIVVCVCVCARTCVYVCFRGVLQSHMRIYAQSVGLCVS